jgi:uncharacterized protein YndB with AHSA1/START domain
MANSKKASKPIKKSTSSKAAPAKKAPAVKKPASKAVAAKAKVPTKKASPAPKKPVASKKVATKPVVSAKSVAPKKVEVKKVVAPKASSKPVAPQKSANTKLAAKPVIAEKPIDKKKVAEKASIVAPKVAAKKPEVKSTVIEKSDKKLAKPSVVPVKDVKQDKKVEKPDDKLDPLHVKAAKAIKELEETMDLSKVRPRIQAGPTPAPKQIVKLKEPPLKLIEPINTTKIKYSLEFEFRSSPKILFNCLSDSSGLAGWFADEVKTKDRIYTFVWEGGESYAKLVAIKDQQLVRFQWLDDTDGTYFQFEIKEDDITSDIALEITDFANPGEKETSIRLWESQVQNLRMLLGSL